MSAVTIPAQLHSRMVETYRREYEDEFGALNAVTSFTRDQLVAKYAADISFWKRREPVIDTKKKPSMRTICGHAITTNAVANMWKVCEERGIEQEVAVALAAAEAKSAAAEPAAAEPAAVESATVEPAAVESATAEPAAAEPAAAECAAAEPAAAECAAAESATAEPAAAECAAAEPAAAECAAAECAAAE
jgi:hypothetical protein